MIDTNTPIPTELGVVLDVQDQVWGWEYTVGCGDCQYIRRYASKWPAENDQLTHEC